MNPLYTKNQAIHHIMAAMQLLKLGGLLVAVISTSMLHKFENSYRGYAYSFSDPVGDLFANTGVSIRILTITKEA